MLQMLAGQSWRRCGPVVVQMWRTEANGAEAEEMSVASLTEMDRATFECTRAHKYSMRTCARQCAGGRWRRLGLVMLADHPPALYHTPESGQLYFLKRRPFMHCAATRQGIQCRRKMDPWRAIGTQTARVSCGCWRRADRVGTSAMRSGLLRFVCTGAGTPLLAARIGQAVAAHANRQPWDLVAARLGVRRACIMMCQWRPRSCVPA